MVMLAMHHPPVQVVAPIAFRIFLLWMSSFATIMSVTRMSSAKEMAKNGASNWIVAGAPAAIRPCRELWYTNMIPVTAQVTLAGIFVASSRRAWEHTQRSEIHQKWESDNPIALEINNIATIELGNLSTSGNSTVPVRPTHQKTIGEPVVQVEHGGGDDANRPGVDERVISDWSGCPIGGKEELSVIDK